MRHRKKTLEIPISFAYWVRNLSSLMFSRVFLHTTRVGPCDRNSYQTLDLGMNLCSWCPERHDKNIRDIRRALKSPCPGILTAIVDVAVLTLTRTIKSVVTGQAPVTLELRNTPGKKNTNKPKLVHMYCPQQIRAISACFGLTQGDL